MNTSKRKRARGESTPADPVSTEDGGSPTTDGATTSTVPVIDEDSGRARDAKPGPKTLAKKSGKQLAKRSAEKAATKRSAKSTDTPVAGSTRSKPGKIVKTSIPMTRAQAARLDALKLRAQILMPRARKRDVVAAALDLLETVTDAKLVALLKADRPNGA